MFDQIKKYLQHVNAKEKAFFSRQLATMLASGLPLTQSLYILSVQSQNSYVKAALTGIIADLEAGYSFSNAIAKYPKMFDKVYVSIVLAGESSGKLESILNEMADQLEKDSAFASRIKSAMIYPAFILLVLVVVAVVMMVKVIPQLSDIFKESGAQLPIATRILIAFSGFLVHYWWACIIILILLVAGIAVLFSTATFHYYFDKFKIRGPIVGELYKGVYMHRFTNTLSILTASGIPIIEAINIVSDVMNNEVYQRILLGVASQVEKGVPMSVPMSKDPNFPLIVSQMIMVGEQTGKIDKVLANLSKYYQDETDNRIKGITSLFEPLIILIIGGGVAFLVFAILMPIYNIAQIQQ